MSGFIKVLWNVIAVSIIMYAISTISEIFEIKWYKIATFFVLYELVGITMQDLREDE